MISMAKEPPIIESKSKFFSLTLLLFKAEFLLSIAKMIDDNTLINNKYNTISFKASTSDFFKYYIIIKRPFQSVF